MITNRKSTSRILTVFGALTIQALSISLYNTDEKHNCKMHEDIFNEIIKGYTTEQLAAFN